ARKGFVTDVATREIGLPCVDGCCPGRFGDGRFSDGRFCDGRFGDGGSCGSGGTATSLGKRCGSKSGEG
ncbi:MAG: hypothetical protein J0H64_10105, partial [Actinobacteria bacterium]|nr:hypothetical protein [Actinomycetota bacterium]